MIDESSPKQRQLSRNNKHILEKNGRQQCELENTAELKLKVPAIDNSKFKSISPSNRRRSPMATISTEASDSVLSPKLSSPIKKEFKKTV